MQQYDMENLIGFRGYRTSLAPTCLMANGIVSLHFTCGDLEREREREREIFFIM
jgi:hypothetical protein